MTSDVAVPGEYGLLTSSQASSSRVNAASGFLKMEGRSLPRIVPADVARRLVTPLPRMAIPLKEELMVVFHSLAVLGAFYYAAPLFSLIIAKLSLRQRWILVAILVVAIGHPPLRELEWIRNMPLWGAWHRYFSTRIVDENKPKPIPRRALIAAVPHGSFPFGAAMSVSGWLAEYLGPLRPIAASAVRLVPILRHTLDGLGGIHATSDSMRTAMLDGRPRDMPNPWLDRPQLDRLQGHKLATGGQSASSGSENAGDSGGTHSGLSGLIGSAVGAAAWALGLPGERSFSAGMQPGSRADRGSERFLVFPGGIAEMYQGTVMDTPLRGAGLKAGSRFPHSAAPRDVSGSLSSGGVRMVTAGQYQKDAALGRSRGSGEHRPEVILLRNRKGFIRVALESGMPVVPVYVFGCSTAMSIGWLSKMLEPLSRLIRASLVVFMGRWGLPIPRRSRFLYAVGKPLFEAPRVPGHPSQIEVNAMHARFVEAIRTLFYRYRSAAGWAKKELVVK